MSSRLKFLQDGTQAHEVLAYLSGHGIKCYLRERTTQTAGAGETPFGYDVYILRDDDLEEAKKLMDYEFGAEWGEIVTSGR